MIYRERWRLELDQLRRSGEEAAEQLAIQRQSTRASQAELSSLKRQAKQMAATLAMEQSLVAAQVHRLPELEERQIVAFAERLKPYRGDAVIFYKDKQQNDQPNDFVSSLTAALELAHVGVRRRRRRRRRMVTNTLPAVVTVDLIVNNALQWEEEGSLLMHSALHLFCVDVRTHRRFESTSCLTLPTQPRQRKPRCLTQCAARC